MNFKEIEKTYEDAMDRLIQRDCDDISAYIAYIENKNAELINFVELVLRNIRFADNPLIYRTAEEIIKNEKTAENI